MIHLMCVSARKHKSTSESKKEAGTFVRLGGLRQAVERVRTIEERSSLSDTVRLLIRRGLNGTPGGTV